MGPHLTRDVKSQQAGLSLRDRYRRGGSWWNATFYTGSGGTTSLFSRLRRAGGTKDPRRRGNLRRVLGSCSGRSLRAGACLREGWLSGLRCGGHYLGVGGAIGGVLQLPWAGDGSGSTSMAAASKPPRGTEGRAAATSDEDAKSPWLGPCGVEGHSHSDSGGERLPASIASGSHASGPTGACETCCAAGSAAVLRAVRLAHGVAVLGRAGFSSSAASEEDS